jgi:hypothetical protein
MSEEEREFSWSDTEPVVEAVEAIAVYTNPKGHVVIRQQNTGLIDEDSFVVIPRDRVPVVIAAMNKEIED